jgi:hypothetical protein
VLTLLNLDAPSPAPALEPQATASPTDAAPPAPAPAAEKDERTIGSRSALYGVVLALAARAGSPDLVVWLNLAAMWLAVWLVARVAVRVWGLSAAPSGVAATLLLAGSSGSLPFYIAFLMPDLLAPILILMLALPCAWFRQMLGWERAFCVILAVAAVVAHPSHLLMAGILVPLAAVIAPVGLRNRLVLLGVLAGIVVGAGVAERLLFDRMVERVQGGQVVYQPFLTARLIDDGPGYAYLASVCPDAATATCALYDRLSQPGDPLRFDAPMLIFSRDSQYGSYRLLPLDVQTAIADEQVRFATRVMLDRPGAVIAAVAENTWRQVLLFSVAMTLPEEAAVKMAVAPKGHLPEGYAKGRLIGGDAGWVGTLTWVHGLVYAASLVAIAVLLAMPRPAGRPVARFVAMVLMGVVANALVCGAISEPAARYGARVMFLLPMTAALLLWARRGMGAEP